MEIRHIPHKEIDKQKWQACIDKAMHPSIYALPLYLDAIAGEWDALVEGDYETVMPLIHRKKYSIKYLYQPPFLPYSGIYSAQKINKKTTDAFLTKAFNLFSFAEINIPYPLQFSLLKNMTTAERNNFIVNLSPSYEELQKNYNLHFSKSLRRLQKLSLQYSASDDIKEMTNLFRELYLFNIKSMKETDIQRFEKACKTLKAAGNLIIRRAFSVEGKLLCGLMLLQYKNRLYNILSCNTDAGKKAEANYFLYDKVMEEFSGKGMLLDLEGSDIKGIEDFYRKMNPENEIYHFIKYNALPRAIKWLK